MANKIEILIAADSSDATRKMSALSKSMTDAGRDSATLGELLNALADESAADLERTRATADKLAQALGDEFVGQLSGGRASVDQYVSELTTLGYSLEEIEADAEQVAAALRKFDGIRMDATADEVDHARRNIDQLSDSGRGANSALANMVGNSAQDLGELGGISGSVGVALGQMAEYASDASLAGEGLGSSLKSMAMVAGPIAAISLGTMLIGKYLEQGKAEAEKLRAASKLVADEIARAVENGDSLAQALANARSKQLTDLFKELFESGNRLTDLAADLAQFGLTYDDVIADVANGTTVVRDTIGSWDYLAAAQSRNTEVANAQSEAIVDVRRELGGLIDFNSQLVNEDQALTDVLTQVKSAFGEQATAVDRATEATRRYSDADREARDGARQSLDEWNTAAHAQYEASQQYAADQEAAIEAWADTINSAYQQAAGSFATFDDAVFGSAATFRAALNDQTADVKAWQDDLTSIASQSSAEFATYLAGWGPAAAGMVHEIANSTPELEQTLAAWQLSTAVASTDVATIWGNAAPEGSKAFRTAMGNEVKAQTGTSATQGQQVGGAYARGVADGINANAEAALTAARSLANRVTAAFAEATKVRPGS